MGYVDRSPPYRSPYSYNQIPQTDLTLMLAISKAPHITGLPKQTRLTDQHSCVGDWACCEPPVGQIRVDNYIRHTQNTRATVSIMDSRAVFRMDIGVYVGIRLWALLKSLYRRSMSFWPAQNN